MRIARRLTLGLLAALVLVTGGTWVYINVVSDDPPARLDVSSTPASTATGPVASGRFVVTGGSRAGYRVDEVLFGQNATAVGRTDEVTGELTLTATQVTAATFTVDMASVASDQSRRDNQYRDRIMAVDRFPTSTFTLAEPITLGSTSGRVTAKATGDLTVRGTTKRVTFDVTGLRDGANVQVSATIPIVFDEWGIPSPSFGPASVEDHGEIEVLLVLAPA